MTQAKDRVRLRSEVKRTVGGAVLACAIPRCRWTRRFKRHDPSDSTLLSAFNQREKHILKDHNERMPWV